MSDTFHTDVEGLECSFCGHPIYAGSEEEHVKRYHERYDLPEAEAEE